MKILRNLMMTLVVISLTSMSFASKQDIGLGGRYVLTLRGDSDKEVKARADVFYDRFRLALSSPNNTITFSQNLDGSQSIKCVSGLETFLLLTVTQKDAKLAQCSISDLTSKWSVALSKSIFDFAPTYRESIQVAINPG